MKPHSSLVTPWEHLPPPGATPPFSLPLLSLHFLPAYSAHHSNSMLEFILFEPEVWGKDLSPFLLALHESWIRLESLRPNYLEKNLYPGLPGQVHQPDHDTMRTFCRLCVKHHKVICRLTLGWPRYLLITTLNLLIMVTTNLFKSSAWPFCCCDTHHDQ